MFQPIRHFLGLSIFLLLGLLLLPGNLAAVNASGGRAYVTNQSADTVSVIDTSSNIVVTTIALPPPTSCTANCIARQPAGLAVTPDGKFVYVANQNNATVSVIDTSTNTVSTTIQILCDCTSRPVGVAITPDGTRAYVTDAAARNAIVVIDTATNTVTTTIFTGAGGNLAGPIAISPDGLAAYYTFGTGSVGRIDTNPNSPTYNMHTTTIAVGSNPTGVAVTPDNAFIYVTNSGSTTVSVIPNIPTFSPITTVGVGAGPYSVAITPNGQFAYVVNRSNGNISVINTTTHSVTTISPTCLFTGQIAITPDGTEAYVADAECTTADVINTANNTVTTRIPVGFSPYGVATAPTGNRSQSQTLTFTCPNGIYPCNNVEQQATDNCGTQDPVTGACSNSDASSMKIILATLLQQTQIQVTFTEVDGHGMCVIPASGNANDSPNFDCTWANFFGDSKPTYGGGPPFHGPFLFPPGTTVNVPYCLHYAHNINGVPTKCVDINVELLNGAAPGTHFNGIQELYVAWNAATTSLFPPLGGPWGSDPTVSPRFYDAPHDDSDTVDYPLPTPTGYPYSPSDQQKVFDITGYFNPTGQAGVDGGIGCTSRTCPKTPNHYAVAFPLMAPDKGELLVPLSNPNPACYVKGLPMLVAFELEQTGTEIFDPNALKAPNYARIAVLQGTVPQGAPLLVPVTLFSPPPPFGFLSSYFAVLSNKNLTTSTNTSQTLYQLQILSNRMGKPLTKNFVVKQSCF